MFQRSYHYDSQLRPDRITTEIPGDVTGKWAAREFSVQFAYDASRRQKLTSYPSGEFVSSDYDGAGYAVGSTRCWEAVASARSTGR